jgi:hypothetical protein
MNLKAIKLSSFSTYLGYTVSVVTFLFGIVMLSGVLFSYVPGQLRMTFGVVLILWGIFRFLNTRMRVKQDKEYEEE